VVQTSVPRLLLVFAEILIEYSDSLTDFRRCDEAANETVDTLGCLLYYSVARGITGSHPDLILRGSEKVNP